MSDDLNQWLKESRNQSGAGSDPRLRVVPRIRGVPLDGGPKLEMDAHGGQCGQTARSSSELSARSATADGGVPGPHFSERTSAATGGDSTCRADSPPQLAATGLYKSYRKGAHPVPVLRGVDITIAAGEFLAIIGQSGSGKSTLLHLLGLLDSPDEGEVWLEDTRVDNAPTRVRDRMRNQRFGMIFQFYHLLPELNALENVLAPLMIGVRLPAYLAGRRRFKQEACEILETVNLGHRLKHKPRELSGGEMQRAAIARALITQPSILLADEPTGNLDRASGEEILTLLRTLNRGRNLTIVMVTHDPSIAQRADRIVRLVDGRLETA